MKVRLAPFASSDLDEVHGYLWERSPAGARRVVQEILDRMDMIGRFPEIGAVEGDLKPKGRYRSLVVQQYKLLYRIDNEAESIWVVRIWDTRRDPRTLRLK